MLLVVGGIKSLNFESWTVVGLESLSKAREGIKTLLLEVDIQL
jgi:hypothetical protein